MFFCSADTSDLEGSDDSEDADSSSDSGVLNWFWSGLYDLQYCKIPACWKGEFSHGFQRKCDSVSNVVIQRFVMT